MKALKRSVCHSFLYSLEPANDNVDGETLASDPSSDDLLAQVRKDNTIINKGNV